MGEVHFFGVARLFFARGFYWCGWVEEACEYRPTPAGTLRLNDARREHQWRLANGDDCLIDTGTR